MSDPGYYDAAGLWHYGEDTTAETYSDLLNLSADAIAAAVPNLVTEALADDATPANAAAAAVDAVLATHDLVESSDPAVPNTVSLYTSAYDWLELEVDNKDRIIAGTLTTGQRVIFDLSAPKARVDELSAGGATVTDETLIGGYLHASVDASGRLLEDALASDGTVPQWLLDRWKTRMGVFSSAARNIVCYGDSLTAWSTTYPVYLQQRIAASHPTVTVYQRAVGGEDSIGITARTNALPYLLSFVGGAIPAAATPVEVTFTSAGGSSAWPLLRGNTYPVAMTGTVAGIPGTLTKTPDTPYGQSDVHQPTDKYYFTRTTAGALTTVNRPTALVLDDARARAGDIHIIWAGRNGPANARVQSDIRAILNARAVIDSKYLVLSVPRGAGEGTGTSAYTNINALNAALFAEHGRRFVDINRYLIDYGLADAGLTPTTQDNADVAADTIPASLRSDTIHLTAAAQQIVARLVNERLTEIGAL